MPFGMPSPPDGDGVQQIGDNASDKTESDGTSYDDLFPFHLQSQRQPSAAASLSRGTLKPLVGRV
jgi:hypothetical protein